VLAMSDDRPASVADIVVEELRKKEINGPIRLPKRDFFTRGQKLKVKDPWHILSGYDLEFAGMSTRERVRVMLEWFGRRQTIALPINSVVGCLIATILLMILSENNVRTPHWQPRRQIRSCWLIFFPCIPLSVRAIAGFYRRIKSSTLSFMPSFLPAVRQYLLRIERSTLIGHE
jgi:hypothetical protein